MLWLPIIFFLCYLNLTVLLFAFGPWAYSVDNPLKLYGFLALAHLSLLFGYMRGIRWSGARYSGRWTSSKFVKVSVLINLLLLLPTSHFRTGSFIPNVAAGIADPGTAYANSLALRASGMPLIEYVRILLGPLLYMALPLTVFYWKDLSGRLRVGGVMSILGTVALFIAMGTNKAIADTVLLVPWMAFAAHSAGRIQLNWKKTFLFATVSVTAFLMFLTFFGFAVSSRQGSPVSVGLFFPADSQVNVDNFLLRNLPPEQATVLTGLDLYLTQGYYALSLALREPFVPMYGVGNSFFLYRQAERITGDSRISDMPYPVRIEEYGWDAEKLWSSIYPWIASDVSFPGTIVVVFFIGKLFALSWLDTLRGENPFAVAMFSIFLIMLFYFPANNQMLQSGEGLTAFWGILILWWRSRRSMSRCQLKVGSGG